MATRPKTVCAQGACNNLTDGKYCTTHVRTNDYALQRRQYDMNRSPEDKAFYASRAWRKMRDLVIMEEPLCRVCGVKPATEVDHILNRRLRPDLQLDRDNLQPICRACHSKKTIADDGGFGK